MISQKSKVKSQKLSIALIGAGGMGRRWAKAINAYGLADLQIVVDQDVNKAKLLADQFQSCRVVTDWRAILRSDHIDAVVVVTPHKFLAPISTAFLEAGKHVLCEKPGGVNSQQVKRAIAIAKKNKLCYMVSFNHRFHEGFRLARKFFEQGKIGNIMFIRARYGFGGRPDYQKEWRFDKSLSGGGELIDQGVHMIDIARWFLGEIKESCGFTANLFWPAKVEDNVFVLLKNHRDQLASVHASWTNWKPIHNFEIYGTKGYLIIDGLGKKYGGEEKLIWGRRSKNFIDQPVEKIFNCSPDADLSLVKEFKEFINAIQEKRQPQPNGEDALEVLKIVEKIYAQK